MERRISPNSFWRLPIVSGFLTLANVIVFLICTFTGDLLYNMGRLEVFGVLVRGEYGRVITAMFLHGDIIHLSNNAVLLFFLGAMLEKEVGHIRHALVCFLSGIGGNVLSLMVKVVTGDTAASVGASGMVFGLDGMLLAILLFSRRKLPTATPARVVLMIGLSLYNGFMGTHVDNAAHVGGLLTGFLVGGILCIADRWPKKKVKEVES